MNYRLFVNALLALFMIIQSAQAQDQKKIIFSSQYSDHQDFEKFVTDAKKAGATHINITNCVPRSFWQYDTPGDPYPGWTVTRITILKVAPPAKIREFIPVDYSDSMLELLALRCKVLRKHGLKAQISITEPAMLPEGVYEKYPMWRGPIVSHPSRSQVVRFAPSTDNPEVQELYREAIGILLKKCPEIDIISILTNDSGAGLDWSTGLYNGQIGNLAYKSIPMHQRIKTFYESLFQGAADAGYSVEINMGDTRERDPQAIIKTLTKGMAIDNMEGPDGRRFMSSAGIGEGYANGFFPVSGIPQVKKYIDQFTELARSDAPRWSVTITDEVNRDLYFKIYRKVMANIPRDEIDKINLIKEIAEESVGKEKVNQYLNLCTSIDDASKYFHLFMYGGYIFNLGCVQQRWLVRPFVPFPEELPKDVVSTYQKFQFQAIPERLNNLADVQACDIYYGWGGRGLTNKIISTINGYVEKARISANEIGDVDLALRLDIYKCILANANNAVSYQAQLDRIEEMNIKPLEHAVVGTQSDWDRQLIMETARNEIDNTTRLIYLLGDHPEKYIRIAATPAEEDISLLGPEIVNQLRLKLKVMNSHWEDYKRIFTTPNW